MVAADGGEGCVFSADRRPPLCADRPAGRSVLAGTVSVRQQWSSLLFDKKTLSAENPQTLPLCDLSTAFFKF